MASRYPANDDDRLSEYERAVCYYTLPKITSATTIGLIAAYLVCLLQAVAALAYGLLTDHPVWTRVGTVALGAIIIFGIVAFLARALYHEIRQRKFLREARTIHAEEPPPPDLPDPFVGHVLLRRPRYVAASSYNCTDNDGNLVYRVESVSRGMWRTVVDAEGGEVVQVHVVSRMASFILASSMPGRLVVYRGGEEIAHISPRFSLGDPKTEIHCSLPEVDKYLVRRRAIYKRGKLLGRIYYLRQHLYLDVEKTECHPAILAYFATMT